MQFKIPTKNVNSRQFLDNQSENCWDKEEFLVATPSLKLTKFHLAKSTHDSAPPKPLICRENIVYAGDRWPAQPPMQPWQKVKMHAIDHWPHTCNSSSHSQLPKKITLERKTLQKGNHAHGISVSQLRPVATQLWAGTVMAVSHFMSIL